MKLSNLKIGFLEAAGLALYVSIFAIAVQNVGEWLRAFNFRPQPVLSTILFLMVFVTSALICGSIILGYPATLFFNGKKREAVEIVLWSIVWLIVFLTIFAVIGLAVISV